MMALTQDDTTTPAPAFQWGANGAQLTPDQIAARRKVAEAMMEKAGDYSPVRSWTQGLARVAQGVVGGLNAREADRAAQANADDNKAMIAALLGGGAPAAAAPVATGGTVPAAASSVPSTVPAAALPPGNPPVRETNDQDMNNPFEPSAADRDAAIRTVYGEAANEPAKGQLAVASVIRNRAFDGGYGGNTQSAVVHAPNQFEPWNGGVARDRMQALSPNDPKYQAIGKVVDAASGIGPGGAVAEDPTEGKTMFYSPGAQAALGRAPPSWAKGEGQVIGGHTFYDDEDGTPAEPKPVQVAGPVAAGVAKVAATQADPGALPAGATPTQGYAVPGASAPVAAPAAVTKVAGALNPNVLQALTSPYASEGTKKIAGLIATQQLANAGKEHFTQETDKDGNVWNVNSNGQRTVALAAEKSTGAQKDFEYGQTHPDFVAQQLAKTKAGAAQLNNQNNIDMNSSQTYDKQLSEGLGKSHAALANGVEDAQSRARDIAAMQGAVDAIQKNGGTTGGLAPSQRLELQKSINAGAAALGMEQPFSEADISDKEFLTKFNRSMAGAQAKNAVGSRVTNFEMSNFLKANPGLDMSITGNQRLLGIQGQIEQRNIAVGNAIRDATASAISSGKKIDPVTVQGIITNYDKEHHIQDPTTGQDLTQSYALPEFQAQGNNPALATDHAANVGKIRRWDPTTGNLH